MAKIQKRGRGRPSKEEVAARTLTGVVMERVGAQLSALFTEAITGRSSTPTKRDFNFLTAAIDAVVEEKKEELLASFTKQPKVKAAPQAEPAPAVEQATAPSAMTVEVPAAVVAAMAEAQAPAAEQPTA